MISDMTMATTKIITCLTRIETIKIIGEKLFNIATKRRTTIIPIMATRNNGEADLSILNQIKEVVGEIITNNDRITIKK